MERVYGFSDHNILGTWIRGRSSETLLLMINEGDVKYEVYN